MRSGPRAKNDPVPSPPRPQSSQVTLGLCASPIHPLIPPAVPEAPAGASPSPNTRSTQHRLRGCRPRLLYPELLGAPGQESQPLKPGQTAISHLPGADLCIGRQLTNHEPVTYVSAWCEKAEAEKANRKCVCVWRGAILEQSGPQCDQRNG